MRCDTCKQESDVIMRVVIAKDYNRSLSRPIFNCPSCFEKKEQMKSLRAEGSGLGATPQSPQPRAQSKPSA